MATPMEAVPRPVEWQADEWPVAEISVVRASPVEASQEPPAPVPMSSALYSNGLSDVPSNRNLNASYQKPDILEAHIVLISRNTSRILSLPRRLLL